MMLYQLIEALEKEDPEKVVALGFDNPHSDRGSYENLAFTPAENVTVDSMLKCARDAVGATYEGWKGGDFKMDEETDVYLGNWGECGETIGPILLGFMMGTEGKQL